MKILLIGEFCEDRTIHGHCSRLCPEAPVPVFLKTRTTTNRGMAGNVLSNIQSLEPTFEVDIIFNKFAIKKTRYIDEQSGYILLRVDEDDQISENDNFYSLDPLVIKKDQYDAIVISDYNKGFISTYEIEKLAKFCNEKEIPLFLDTKKFLGKWSEKVTFVKINAKEFEDNLNYWNKNDYDFKNKICQHLIVTLGKEGASLYQEDFNHVLEPIDVKNSCGCGDSFLSGLVVEYLKTRDIRKSIIYANKVARFAASKSGIISVSYKDIKD